MHKSPVRYFDSFIAIETYICMTSMVMLSITMEVSINKSLPIKGKTQAKLGHSWEECTIPFLIIVLCLYHTQPELQLVQSSTTRM